jgi:hypothetical protein
MHKGKCRQYFASFKISAQQAAAHVDTYMHARRTTSTCLRKLAHRSERV